MINERTSKFIFFKRQEITAGQHLNYTWLVGVDQEKPNADLMYQAPVMEMAHLTLMRSRISTSSNTASTQGCIITAERCPDQLDKLFGRPFEALTAKGLSQQEIKDIFRRSLPALINFPTEAPLVATSLPTIDARFDNVADIGFLTHDQRVRVLDSVNHFITWIFPDTSSRAMNFTSHFSRTKSNQSRSSLLFMTTRLVPKFRSS